MYSNVRSWVRVNGQYSEEFGVGVGVHQGSVFSPRYVDKLVVIADTLKGCNDKLKAWKRSMKHKGQRVNIRKTKLMVSSIGVDVPENLGRYPCAVCCTGVGESNTIQCTRCMKWVHRRKNAAISWGRKSPLPTHDLMCVPDTKVTHALSTGDHSSKWSWMGPNSMLRRVSAI